jgi:hypothetical protein
VPTTIRFMSIARSRCVHFRPAVARGTIARSSRWLLGTNVTVVGDEQCWRDATLTDEGYQCVDAMAQGPIHVAVSTNTRRSNVSSRVRKMRPGTALAPDAAAGTISASRDCLNAPDEIQTRPAIGLDLGRSLSAPSPKLPSNRQQRDAQRTADRHPRVQRDGRPNRYRRPNRLGMRVQIDVDLATGENERCTRGAARDGRSRVSSARI